jgi:hypothetical protein
MFFMSEFTVGLTTVDVPRGQRRPRLRVNTVTSTCVFLLNLAARSLTGGSGKTFYS